MTLYTIPPYSGMSVELSTPEQIAEIYGKLYDLGLTYADDIFTKKISKYLRTRSFLKDPTDGKFTIIFYSGSIKIHHIPYEQWLEMLK